MRAGLLKRPISIQSQTTTQDSFGQPQSTWSDVLDCWAAINVATSKQVYAASGFTSQVSHKITIRYTDTVLRTNMRVLFGSRVFLIQAVTNPDEGTREIDLLCLELNEGQ